MPRLVALLFAALAMTTLPTSADTVKPDRDDYAYDITARLLDEPPEGMHCKPSRLVHLEFAVVDRHAATFVKDRVTAQVPCPNTFTNTLRKGGVYYLDVWRYRHYAEWPGGPELKSKPS